MDVAENASREVCAVCWGVCGFASSRENLEMAKSQEGLTSFCQARDLLAASDQCEMCDYLFNQAKEDTNHFELDARIAINIRFYKFGGSENFKRAVDNLGILTKVEGKDSRWVADSDWSEELGFITWSVLAHRDDPAAAEIRYSPVNHDVSSSTKQAKSWIEECKQLHKHCPEPAIPLLPTRVLEVGEQAIRLHIPNGERCHYCALSYCWGGPQPVRTLAENIESHRVGIQVSAPPQTIQDAISYTRKLGVKYLWIDSLCIVQDSVDDKRQEIARMASIYQNASVTIAATNASSCVDGFLSKRRRPSYETFIGDLPWSCLDGKLGKVSLHRQYSGKARGEPLERRAWALQEFLLSPRVLSFSSQQLVWECQTVRYTDGGNPESQGFFEEMGKIRREPSMLSPLTAAIVSRSPRSMAAHEVWGDVVKDFTRRGMTEEGDKLLAISGIAQQLHLMTGDEYLAGLWKTSLMSELMWSHDLMFDVAKGHQPARRPETYRAPSWSWASVDGAIKFCGSPDYPEPVTEVIQCEVLLANSSKPFGAVIDGRLVIRGPLRSLGIDEVLQYFDLGPTAFTLARIPRMILDGNEVLAVSSAVSLPDSISGDAQVDQRIWLLEMGRYHAYPCGFVLRQASQKDHRSFRRIGWFDTRSTWFDAAWWTRDFSIETITIV